MTYKLSVTYAAGHTHEHPGLTAEQIETGAGAFVRDLVGLSGEGITRLVAEVEPAPEVVASNETKVAEQPTAPALVRSYNAEDARRERAVEMFKRHAREVARSANYDVDIEFLEHAVIAFADEWAAGSGTKPWSEVRAEAAAADPGFEEAVAAERARADALRTLATMAEPDIEYRSYDQRAFGKLNVPAVIVTALAKVNSPQERDAVLEAIGALVGGEWQEAA